MDVTRILIADGVARTLAYWLWFWRTHCWSCQGERDYEDEQQRRRCPHCGAEDVPF